MGYDLYGVNPLGYDKGEYPVLTKWEDKTFEERDKMPEKDQDKYWDEMGRRDSETGGYFRANVWWWRQLWNFTCQVCEDVMTDDDRNAGDSNSGTEITEETCVKMLPLMNKAIKEKDHEKYEAEVTQAIDDCPKDKNGWPKGDDNWWANYPFSSKFFEQFTVFVERSGGFTIS